MDRTSIAVTIAVSAVVALFCSRQKYERQSNEFSVVYVTVPSKEIAASVAKALLQSSPPLAACVNSIPNVQSTYKWKGKIESEEEILLMIKTRTTFVAEISRLLTEDNKVHPYDVPEVIAVPIQAGSPAYLEWVGKNTK